MAKFKLKLERQPDSELELWNHVVGWLKQQGAQEQAKALIAAGFAHADDPKKLRAAIEEYFEFV